MSEAGTRYEVITSNNQSANVWVCGLISVLFATACMFARIAYRARLGIRSGQDDYVFWLAWAVQVIQSGLLLKATALGLGKNDSIVAADHVSSIQTYAAASTVLTVVSIYVAKVSMILLISRLFARSLRSYYAAVAVVGVAAAIQIQAGCVYPTCTKVASRYYANAALDIATEVLIIGLPVYCIRDVRMAKVHKAKVLATFSARSLMVLFAGLIVWSATRIRETGKLSTSIVLPVVLLQLQLGLSLCICAIVPCFRMIFQSTDIVSTTSGDLTREGKQISNHSNRARSFGRPTQGTGTDTQISYIRQPTPPPPDIPRKPEHSAQRSQDTSGAASHTTGRPSEGGASDSSLVPSATTGLSTKPLVQAPEA
ncbi:uncharacterized protein PV09_07275 [Verruconis gallopava]|uniref:Rhodopsin domain-containing protein n=1 Tax=Verruconis gallopava TaxID=253628 RepID=A0A0D1YK33_9PEZI|nr:uncharacterized protein PV09_07275 [Verruconis gallopava]KIW01232.1 hypothetical protein PV09_07275 [Verruconis gallopava]